jgi:deleted-in-malignant-brain-tumors protein 1
MLLLTGSSVRLVGGTRFEGLMELFYNGVWGTVCDDNFDTNTKGPTVTCKMLGLSR